MLVCFLGIVVIFWEDLRISNIAALLGMGAIAASVIIQALSLVQVKKWGGEMSPVVQNLVGMVMGMVILGLLGLLLEGDQPIVWTAPAILSLLYLSLVASVLAFVAYYWLLQRIDPVYLALTSFINPIVALLLGALILGESLRLSILAGAALVMAGLLVANGRSLAAKFLRARERPDPAS
jgi:drug/metabolite transporter (DMT)-like permease